MRIRTERTADAAVSELRTSAFADDGSVPLVFLEGTPRTTGGERVTLASLTPVGRSTLVRRTGAVCGD